MAPTKKQRLSLIEKNLSNISCLRMYKIGKKPTVLGEGTVGTVILLCTTAGSCFAAKVQILSSKKERDAFQRETQIQRDFYPYAPKVHTECVDIIDDITFGTIVMELTDGDLEKELTVKKTNPQLKSIMENLCDMFKFVKNKKFIHGDLSLFNIAYVKRMGVRSLIFIDFGTSSAVKSIYDKFSQFDTIRFITELYPEFRSKSKRSKDILKSNTDYLLTHVIQLIGICGLSASDISKGIIENLWERQYCSYCKATNLDCPNLKQICIDVEDGAIKKPDTKRLTSPRTTKALSRPAASATRSTRKRPRTPGTSRRL